MLTDLGLYVHIPFCESKCSYCGFYSFSADKQLREDYVKKLIREINLRGVHNAHPVKSLYIGGGTPTVLEAEQLSQIIAACKSSFQFEPDAEITVEANPADNLAETFKVLRALGVNRLSLGVQSAVEEELKILGRRQNNADVIRTVKDARAAGIENISLDLMLGIPFQTEESLKRSIDFLLSLEPNHISAYILSLEEGTELCKLQYKKDLPDDDATAELYEIMCDCLRQAGFTHYEISNFAKNGMRSRHNSHYWQCGEYLGFGAASHSFFNGRRFHCPPDISEFLKNPVYIDDGEGGTDEEYIMLGLRLKEGIDAERLTAGREVVLNKARMLEKAGLMIVEGSNIRLTEKGILVSNSVINEVIL